MNAREEHIWPPLVYGCHQVGDVCVEASLGLSLLVCQVLEDQTAHLRRGCIDRLTRVTHVIGQLAKVPEKNVEICVKKALKVASLVTSQGKFKKSLQKIQLQIWEKILLSLVA